jgi:ABC-type bacteriocin/lantibiotic exporter with double-glycine peptidase domain
MVQQRGALSSCDFGEIFLPVAARLGALILAGDGVEHQVQEVSLVADVPVERHGPGAHALAEAVIGSLAIEAVAIEKSFGKTHALAGLDLGVQPGTILGLLGPNGSGKTTAVRVLTTLLRPDRGTARVAGYDVVAQARRCGA